MNKRIEPIGIVTIDGAIDIIQADPIDDERSAVVRITTDQVDILIDWLKEAKAELLANGEGVNVVRGKGWSLPQDSLNDHPEEV
jgi:hypothetical protein